MKIKIIFIMIAAALSVSACSSTPPTNSQLLKAAQEKQTATIRITEINGGNIKIGHDSDGNFVSLTSTASVKLLSDLSGEKDSALTVATLKARAQIAEFLQTGINSRKVTQQIAETVQKQSPSINKENASDDFSDPTNQSVEARVTRRVREQIVQSTDKILKGTVVTEQYIDTNTNSAVVTVEFSKILASDAATINGIMQGQ